MKEFCVAVRHHRSSSQTSSNFAEGFEVSTKLRNILCALLCPVAVSNQTFFSRRQTETKTRNLKSKTQRHPSVLRGPILLHRLLTDPERAQRRLGLRPERVKQREKGKGASFEQKRGSAKQSKLANKKEAGRGRATPFGGKGRHCLPKSHPIVMPRNKGGSLLAC